MFCCVFWEALWCWVSVCGLMCSKQPIYWTIKISAPFAFPLVTCCHACFSSHIISFSLPWFCVFPLSLRLCLPPPQVLWRTGAKIIFHSQRAKILCVWCLCHMSGMGPEMDHSHIFVVINRKGGKTGGENWENGKVFFLICKHGNLLAQLLLVGLKYMYYQTPILLSPFQVGFKPSRTRTLTTLASSVFLAARVMPPVLSCTCTVC